MLGEEDGTPLDQIRFLARAESRVRILEHLVESGSMTQRELRTRLDASRTTVARSLRSLEENDWVESTDGTYRLTRVGAIIADEFSDMLDTIRATEDVAAFLRWFPADTSAPDFHEAEDAEVTSYSDADPYAPARKQTEILHTADRLRILLPAIDLDSTNTITEQVTERGLEVETVVSPGVESTLESDEFAPILREKLGTGRSTISVAHDTLPFYLGLADDGRIQIGVADDEGFPRALLETTDETTREWGETVYQEYREQARPKPIQEF